MVESIQVHLNSLLLEEQHFSTLCIIPDNAVAPFSTLSSKAPPRRARSATGRGRKTNKRPATRTRSVPIRVPVRSRHHHVMDDISHEGEIMVSRWSSIPGEDNLKKKLQSDGTEKRSRSGMKPPRRRNSAIKTEDVEGQPQATTGTTTPEMMIVEAVPDLE